jgi:hypothetical protein
MLLFWVCVLSLRYPARNEPALYCHLSSVRLYKVFTHILITARLSKRNYYTLNVFRFSLQLFRKNFHSRKNWEKYDKKSYIGLLFLSDFKATWTLSTVFRKRLKYQILWKSVQWETSCSMRTDGQTDMTKLIVAFRNFAKSLKICTKICNKGEFFQREKIHRQSKGLGILYEN